MIRNSNCITVKELKDYIKDWVEKDEYGEDYQVWIGNDHGTSNPCWKVCRLNKGDIIFE